MTAATTYEHVILLSPDSGGYVAECPELHAVTQGDTLGETLANLREVIELALEEEPADPPSPVETTGI